MLGILLFGSSPTVSRWAKHPTRKSYGNNCLLKNHIFNICTEGLLSRCIDMGIFGLTWDLPYLTPRLERFPPLSSDTEMGSSEQDQALGLWWPCSSHTPLVVSWPRVVMMQSHCLGSHEPVSLEDTTSPCQASRHAVVLGRSATGVKGSVGGGQRASWQSEDGGVAGILHICVCKCFVTVMRKSHLLSLIPFQNCGMWNTVAVVVL